MNFVFINPQFPHTYFNFCDRLHKNGVNVLAIGDSPYETLAQPLKNVLTEYYKVDDMEDYEQVFKAVAFFSFQYGKIDWLESNNEYWLAQDARLRTDFNITTGANTAEVAFFRSKFGMKKYYAKAGVPTARCKMITTLKAAQAFVKTVGYPVIVKPDNGVGASHTYKLSSDEELTAFFEKPPEIPYVIEEFVEGELVSYDAITNSKCEPLFESMTAWPPSIMDIVNDQLDLNYYVTAEVPAALAEAGRATVKAFGARSRFVHLEFFKLLKDRPGLGKAGDYVGLEVNMRPAGGYTPDMMDFAHNTDVYQIWADMVTHDSRVLPVNGGDHFCVYAGRRDQYNYKHSHDDIMAKFGEQIVMHERLPEIWFDAMGSEMYTAHADDEEAAIAFIQFVGERA